MATHCVVFDLKLIMVAPNYRHALPVLTLCRFNGGLFVLMPDFKKGRPLDQL
jgi:hypothetical protein